MGTKARLQYASAAGDSTDPGQPAGMSRSKPTSKKARKRARKLARAQAHADQGGQGGGKLSLPAAPAVADPAEARRQFLAALASLPLEQQERELGKPIVDVILTANQYNQERRRIEAERERLEAHVRALRVPCCCVDCVNYHSPRVPRYYAPSLISFECALNRSGEALLDLEIDDGLAEELAARGVGSVSLVRTPSQWRGRSRRPIG